MYRFVLGNPLLVFLAPILLSGVAYKLLKKRKASAQGKKEDPDPGAASSLMQPIEDYDVFLSCRGVDARQGFVAHLYHCLVAAGIHVLIDDDELGETIGTDPDEPIKKIKILIPIISVNYGSSKWCLDKLVCMMECNKRSGHTVLPIFYKVQPAEVGCQDGSFGKAFHFYGRRRPEPEMEKWKKALAEVASLNGWESDKVANGREGDLVELIVKKVLNELKKATELVFTENFVGIDSHVAEIMELVEMSSDANLCVGIHGIGGIGKTTLAKVIYNKLSHLFEHRSFIADIRESCMQNSIEYLQRQLISNILGNDIPYDKHKGINFISSKFQDKKVLILLDDVDTTDQLEALAGNLVWFAPGSRVIVTTRNKRILDGAGVYRQYEPKEMDEDQSMILFSRYAFRKDSPPHDFSDLSRLVVSTSRGLPLALKVIGSLLCGKNVEAWVYTIKELQRIPCEAVQAKLKISYDALDMCQKEIFLDIACLLIGNDAKVASYMWDACHFFPDEGIEVLMRMSLIRIGDNNEFIMHDQLKNLGREIVRCENYDEPHKRSRLWDYDEAWEVLERNKGTRRIKAICLEEGNLTRIADEDNSDYVINQGSLTFTDEQFRNLSNLRFLHMSDVNLIGDFNNLFHKLTWLKWGNCPPNFEASNFHAPGLVILDLSRSLISDGWSGWPSMMKAQKLKVLNLTGCCSLKSTFCLSAFKRLEILILRDCGKLEQIHPLIGEVENLLSLDLRGCSCLKKLPRQLGKLEQLKELLLDQSMIEEIPSSIDSLRKLEMLSAEDCKKLARLPDSIGHLLHLRCLSLGRCHQLREIPSSIGTLKSLTQMNLSGCSCLKELPYGVGQLRQLEELLLDQTRIREIPSSIGYLEKLETLSAQDCKSLRLLPTSIGNLVSLSTLVLSGCVELAALPDSIGSLVNLRCLSLGRCHRLREIPNSIGNLKLLTKMDLGGCSSLEELPLEMGGLEQLKELLLDQTMIREIPSSIGSLKNLKTLSAKDCKLLLGPNSIGSLVNLSTPVL